MNETKLRLKDRLDKIVRDFELEKELIYQIKNAYNFDEQDNNPADPEQADWSDINE